MLFWHCDEENVLGMMFRPCAATQSDLAAQRNEAAKQAASKVEELKELVPQRKVYRGTRHDQVMYHRSHEHDRRSLARTVTTPVNPDDQLQYESTVECFDSDFDRSVR